MSEEQFTTVVLAVDDLSNKSLEVKGVIVELLALNARLTLELCQLRRMITEREIMEKHNAERL